MSTAGATAPAVAELSASFPRHKPYLSRQTMTIRRAEPLEQV